MIEAWSPQDVYAAEAALADELASGELMARAVRGLSEVVAARVAQLGAETVVALVGGGNNGADAAGTVESRGGSVLGTGFTTTDDSDVTDVTDPGLGALQDNGGATATRLPATGSPAVDRGVDFDDTAALTTDHDDLGARVRTLTHAVKSVNSDVTLHGHYLPFRGGTPTVRRDKAR